MRDTDINALLIENARLINLNAELLEALEDARRHIDVSLIRSSARALYQWETLAEKIDKIIAKAKGKT